MKLENKQIGIFAALIIATIMLFLPGPDKNRYSFNPELIAKTINEGSDQIQPKELSQWIIEGRNDYQLIDIRSPEEFSKGHIKGAQNIPLKTLLAVDAMKEYLSDTKLIVLYSNGNSHAHQAWLVLISSGYNTYVLQGGYNYWNESVLNPKAPSAYSDDEVLKYQTDKAVADYFGGGTGTEVNNDKSNTAPNKTIIRKAGKKKLQGC